MDYSSEISFDDDCSQVQCPVETSLCPPDSVERHPAPIVDVLYGPDEFLPPHEFYDDDVKPADVIQHQYDELPLHVSAVMAPTNTSTATATTSPTTTTSTQSADSLGTEFLEPKKEFKRELVFDNANMDDLDEHQRLLGICCVGVAEENRRRRRRLRRSSVASDCECKPCEAIPQCSTGEVAIRVHEAAGSPGDCCPRYACEPKPACGDTTVIQTYWQNACTRCSCYGPKGVELCHNECPEMEQQETERSCYSDNLQEPQLHGSEWYENHFCTKCRCDNGVRECVESLCKPVGCSNPIKVEGQCCPQCPTGVEDILVVHENSTNSTSREQRLLKETTTVSSTVGSASPEMITASTLPSTETSTTVKASTESSTLLIGFHSESTSTESITTSRITEASSSSTEIWSSTRNINDIAADGYFGLRSNFTFEGSDSTTQEIIDDLSESFSVSVLAAQSYTSSPTMPSQTEFTEPSSTTSKVSTASQPTYTESSNEESSTQSTQSTKDLSTTTSTSMLESTTTVSAVVLRESESSTESSTETPAASSPTESTTLTNSSNASTSHLASTKISSTTGFSTTTASGSYPTTAPTTTASTTSTTVSLASSPHTLSSTTSTPYSYTASPSATPSTPTTSSPYSSTVSTQPATTFVYWYTFSTSAPSPPIPQPTVYQPSVRTFFTRPVVRYIGATVFVAFLAICALAVWKFCMPTRSVRLKNRYRTVPSSEATSLSHSPTTSHSSMA
ncbi:mucin-5AC-like [Rhagoletis pomonella]|uniref:mucin-5AC-like n=1 Tax=Rhagoletis pomonella TaxID=28610 RepID=UPI001780252D|nr:mucin-5AC-like [Rhagoletis pomonella]